MRRNVLKIPKDEEFQDASFYAAWSTLEERKEVDVLTFVDF